MQIVNEFIVSRTVYNHIEEDEEANEDKLYIAELTEVDPDTDNIEFSIKDDDKTTYIKFRFSDLQRLVNR